MVDYIGLDSVMKIFQGFELARLLDREGRPRLVFPLAQSVWRLDLVAGHFERLLTTPAKIQRAREAGPGRLALMTSEGQVSLWDSASARELGRFDLGDPCDRAASLAATTSGTHLAVGPPPDFTFGMRKR